MKTIRIIISPLVFIFIFLSMLIIPIGILCLLMGIIEITGAVLLEEKIEKDNIEFTLIWFILPYLEAKKFINGKHN